MFKPVRSEMHGNVTESHPDFDKLGGRQAKEAAARASKTSGMSEDQTTKALGAVPEIRAKYKIEVMFEEHRTIAGPNLLGIQLWESGKKFHGGGDELMYWCMDTESNMGCKSPIPSDFIKGPFAICPACQQAISMERAANMRVLRVTTRALSEELERCFRALGSNADIYLKFHKTDIRVQAMEKAKGPDVARRLKGMHIYPLKNILKDTSSGSDVAGRFYAFLTS